MGPSDKLLDIDGWIIDTIAQPITWRVEWYLEKSAFWLARVAMIFGIAADVLFFQVIAPIKQNGMDMRLYFGIWLAVALIFKSGLFLGSFFKERKAQKAATNGRMNPERSNPVSLWFRLGLAAILLIDTVRVLSGAYHILNYMAFSTFVVFFYFCACQSMPPRWHKEKERQKQEKTAVRATPQTI